LPFASFSKRRKILNSTLEKKNSTLEGTTLVNKNHAGGNHLQWGNPSYGGKNNLRMRETENVGTTFEGDRNSPKLFFTPG